MKRSMFIDYDPPGSYRYTKRVTRQAHHVNPVSVGVIVGDSTVDDVVLELEVRNDGRWSLVQRRYGDSTGKVLSEGNVS